MKLVANQINGLHLRDLLPAIGVEEDCVLAAVAYSSSASDITQYLFGHCVENKHCLVSRTVNSFIYLNGFAQ